MEFIRLQKGVNIYSILCRVFNLKNIYDLLKNTHTFLCMHGMMAAREELVGTVNAHGTDATNQFIGLFQVDYVLQLLDSQFGPDDVVADAQNLCSIQSGCLWIQNGAAAQARWNIQARPNVNV